MAGVGNRHFEPDDLRKHIEPTLRIKHKIVLSRVIRLCIRRTSFGSSTLVKLDQTQRMLHSPGRISF
jgi:hypothetical protein